MPKRRCQTCQELFDKDAAPGWRCPSCQEKRTTELQARPGSSSRGLGWDFSRRKAADQGYQSATHCQCRGCPSCGQRCGQAFSQANPKTAGHTVARSEGGHDSPILAVCRRCNSSDGGRLAHQ